MLQLIGSFLVGRMFPINARLLRLIKNKCEPCFRSIQTNEGITFRNTPQFKATGSRAMYEKRGLPDESLSCVCLMSEEAGAHRPETIQEDIASQAAQAHWREGPPLKTARG